MSRTMDMTGSFFCQVSIEMLSIYDGLAKSIALLKEHGATPANIALTRSAFEQLKKECKITGTYDNNGNPAPRYFMGVRITIKDE